MAQFLRRDYDIHLMLIFPCKVCNTQLSAEEAQVGKLVRCPTCSTTLRVPEPARNEQLVGAGVAGSAAGGGTALPPRKNFESLSGTAMRSAGGKRYGFHCGYCSSRLEANESMAGQQGQCPTCGKTIIIPILDRYGRLIDPMTGKIIKQDPHPVHAYAAAGDRAPRILRQPGGQQNIMCPRCSTISSITANNCKSCGMPFTMEGTTIEAGGANDAFCVASLVLGVISIVTCVFFVAGILAIIFGSIGYHRVSKAGAESGGKGMAIGGIVCGIVGCLFGMMVFHGL